MTQQTVNSSPQNHEGDSSLDLLIKLHEHSSNEALQLIHSMFRDWVVLITVTAAIVGGRFISERSEFLIIIPIFLGIYCNIILGKLRTNNLIRCYIIYLERLINIKLGKAIMVWNSILVRKNVSAGRQNKWGNIGFACGTVVAMSVYVGVAYWIYALNGSLFDQYVLLTVVYIALTLLPLILAIYQIVSLYKITKKYTPEYIEKEVAEYQSEFIPNR